MNTAEAFEKFIISLEANDRSHRTIDTYSQRLFSMLTSCEKLEQITPEMVDGWIVTQRRKGTLYGNHPSRPEEEKKLSPVTIYNMIRNLKTFFNFCVRRGYIERSPAAHLGAKRPTRKELKAIKKEDVIALVEAAREHANKTGQYRDIAIILFMLDTGCRSGEVCSVTFEGIDLDKRQATVTGKSGPRVVFFTVKTAKAIKKWLGQHPGSDYVFCGLGCAKGKQMTPNSIYIMFKTRGKGINGRKNPHGMRHFVGQQWCKLHDLERTAQKLGHSDLSVTRIYANVDNEEIKKLTDDTKLI